MPEPIAAKEQVLLDGTEGEGGGQILRSALSLSLITGRPFRISHIRARRSPPGLRPQHLACVRGAEVIGSAQCQGAEVGASELEFSPGSVRGGKYLFEVGTAGSAPLLLQCLFFPIALAGGGELTLRGGTHLPHSPSYHYLVWVWLPMLRSFGFEAQIQLRYAGFYPEGGGEFRATIPSAASPTAAADFRSRGTLKDVDVTSFVGGLPFNIAERQTQAAVAVLRERGIYCNAENVPLPAGRSAGSAIFIRTEFERTIAGFGGLGERGRPAEHVGQDAAKQVANFMESAGAVDEHLADQLLLPAGLLAAGRLGAATPGSTVLTTSEVTAHMTTNAMVVERFLPVRVEIASSGSVTVRPAEQTRPP
jgi:RNA 3'-terminal phosphate cyclase (ATP)